MCLCSTVVYENNKKNAQPNGIIISLCAHHNSVEVATVLAGNHSYGMCTCTRFYIARCIFHAATYRTGCLLLFIHRNVLGAILTTHTHRLTLTHDTLVSQLEPSHSGRHAMHDAQ